MFTSKCASFLVGLSLLLLTACSPEASRTRGGGPGADVGNRGASVQLHGGNFSATGEPNLNPRIATAKK